MKKYIHKPFLLTCALLLLVACAGDTKDGPDTIKERPVEEIYNEAASELDNKQYKTAQKLFEDVERLYPYSSWATQAQMMAAYAAYQDVRYDEAVMALDRFIDLHPAPLFPQRQYQHRRVLRPESTRDVSPS
jgi:outer membrane protein assembly factor BamD